MVTCYRQYNNASSPQANVAYSAYGAESLVHHQWFPNTGASNHATPSPSVMSSTADYTSSDTLRVGNGSGLFITSIGSASVATPSRIFKCLMCYMFLVYL